MTSNHRVRGGNVSFLLQLRPWPLALIDDYSDARWGGWCPLLMKHEMTAGWQPDGKGSGQHTGVLWIHVLHAHDICTYSALIYRVVESWLFCHVVVRWRGCWHSDSLPLESEYRNGEHRVKATWIPNKTNTVLSYYLLCKVDINPEDNHQDDRSWNKNCKSNIGSLHAIIHINNYNGGNTK